MDWWRASGWIVLAGLLALNVIDAFWPDTRSPVSASRVFWRTMLAAAILIVLLAGW